MVSHIWCWDQSSSFKLKKKLSAEWCLGNKRQGGGMTSGTPPGKAYLPEDLVPPPFTELHAMKSALWLRMASVCLLPGLQGVTSHLRSQKTCRQVTQSILSSLVLRMLPLTSSQWRINCDHCTLFPYKVVQLLDQLHKYMTGFLKKWGGQKSYTLILTFPVGASFQAGLIDVLANCPTSKPKSVGKSLPIVS